LLAISLTTFGQDDISIYGVVRDHFDNKKMPNVDIAIYADGKTLFQKKTNLNGKYEFILDFNHLYRIVYTFPNYVSKYLTIDARDIPKIDQTGGFEMNIDMTLFHEIENLDVSILDDPIGKFQYDATRGSMEWDMAYTAMMQKKIRDLMREHDRRIQDEMDRLEEIQKNFDNLVKQGNSSMSKKEYENAVGYYQEALVLVPDDESVKQKLADAQANVNSMAALKEKEAKYDGFIQKGDASYNTKSWEDALSAYQAASEIFPEETYPKKKIEDINLKITEEKRLGELAVQIAALMKQGDELVADKQYDAGIEKFNEILVMEANNTVAKQKIADAKKQKNAWLKAQELDKQYNELITQADGVFDAKNYQLSIEKYKNASKLKPDEIYPKEQITKAEGLLKEALAEAEKTKKFQGLVHQGDTKIASKNYQEGIDIYNEALVIIPGDVEVKAKIEKANIAMAAMLAAAAEAKKQKEINDKFNALVLEGDKAVNTKDYNSAIDKYNQALVLKPDDSVVKNKIDAAQTALEALLASKKLDDQFNAVIATADKLFASKDYDGAKNSYVEASGLKPNESYPKDKITEIDQILAGIAAAAEAKKQKELDDSFNALVEEGDVAVNSKDYEAGIEKYNQALKLKPEDSAVKDKIVDARAAMNALLAAKEIDDKYNAAIASADKYFSAKDYDNAKNSYNEASGLKPGEAYPKDKIAEINQILTDIIAADEAKKQKDLDDKFNALVKQGDDNVALTEYGLAIENYKQALEVIPGNAAVQTKIDEATKKQNEKMASMALSEQYLAIIKDADKLFADKNYEPAATKYREAYDVKNEQYPLDQIDEIKRLQEDIASKANADKQARFAALEAEADAYVKAADYEKGIEKYGEALVIIPDVQRVIDKKTDAEAQLANYMSVQELDAKYNDLISRADLLFGDKTYPDARDLYVQASAVKADEMYPKKKVEEIDLLLLEMKQKANDEDRMARFRELESQGDAAVSAINYTEAIDFYSQALDIVEDNDVKQKKNNAEQLLAQSLTSKGLDEQYNKAIDKADAEFTAEDYRNAKQDYKLAFNLKPEDYPKNKIIEIDEILLEMEREKAKMVTESLAVTDTNTENDGDWVNNTSDENRYLQAQQREIKERQNRKYAELLAYKEALKKSQKENEQFGEEKVASNALIIEEQKNINNYLWDRTKKQDKKRRLDEVKMVREINAMWKKDIIEAQQNRTLLAYEEIQQQHQGNSEWVQKQEETILTNYEEIKRDAIYYKRYGEDKEARLTNMEEVERQKAALINFYEKNSIEQDARIKNAKEENSRMTKNQKDNLSNANTRLELNNKKNQNMEEIREREINNWQEKANFRREMELAKVNKSKASPPGPPKDYSKKSGSEKYAQGVTEETYVEGANQVVKRIVVKGNKVDIYKMVVTKHKVYYFKNGDSISKSIWDLYTGDKDN